MPSWFAAHPHRTLLAILLLAFLVYAPALGNGFVMDGKVLVQIEGNPNPNRLVAELKPLGEYFSRHYWFSVGETSNLYRPVTILSYALTRAWLAPLCGDHALAQHLVNLLLHLGATALVFALVRRAGATVAAALAATLVFGLHAIHSEVVAGIVGRAELLGFVCGAGGVLLALRGGWLSLTAASALFFLAACAKESALPWPLVIPLLLLCRAWTEHLAAPLRPVLGAAMRTVVLTALPAWVLFLWLRAMALADLGEPPSVAHAMNPLAAADPVTRIATALVTQVYGLWQELFPFRLTSDYGAHTFTLRTSLFDPVVLGSLALLATLAAGAWIVRRRHPLLGLAGAWFFGFTLVTANLLFPTGTIYGERLYYTPSLAASVLAAWLCMRAANRRAFAAALAVWSVACAAVILERNPYWADDAALYLGDVDVNPRSSRLHVAAANILLDQGQPQQALAHLEQAVAVVPEHAAAWANLAAVRLQLGDRAGGEAALRRGLAAPWIQREDAIVLHLNLARVLSDTGRAREAYAELARFAATRRDEPVIWQTLLEVAPPELPAPERARMQLALAESLAARGYVPDARRAFEQLLALPALEPEIAQRARAGLARIAR